MDGDYRKLRDREFDDYGYEHKQDLEMGTTCPVCLGIVDVDHHNDMIHRFCTIVNLLIIEYLFDYNDGPWLQMHPAFRFNIIGALYDVNRYSPWGMQNSDFISNREQLINRLVITGKYNAILDRIQDVMELYPDVSEQLVYIDENLMQLCIQVYNLRI